ncbi:MAG: NAD(P)/FAD-dependent oxidoreductase [Paludisphaera borealis]|uniref:NAD(P)/FAD-dependent oxidoreductase n=1 Tax=Paludisphaera borealis TaxID=1387353 RepID=UPI002841EAFB|nr:NAD(P)/FAD-dependent oxidoreductase [Paludisphaera borealis]MDR3620434.1 NAD(P)/FAD-dependent oxidoreductase [Paludisphaera borealis]
MSSLDGEAKRGAATQGLHRVVVIGAGFGGLAAIQALRRAPVRLSVVDRQNHHLFQPLLYQVATAGLNPSDISGPIRRILRQQRNADILLADVVGVDLARRTVILADGELGYDSLIIAAGATHSYFDHPEWEEFAPGLKSIEDALVIRRKVLLAFEIAERETDEARRREWLTFVIVGGGPTGVELAGTLRDVARMTLNRDFRHIDPASARVILIEGSPRVLPSYVEQLSESAKRQLETLGVEVRSGVHVTGIDAEGVWIGSERIKARTVLWAAGVSASPLGRMMGVPLDRAGRVIVEPDLTIAGHPEVYVIGDLAHAEQDGRPVPGVAPAAAQMGKHAARSILRALDGKPREPFRYVDKGSLATIGRGAAVAQIGRLKISGFFAWLLWLFVHIFFLIGFRNRLFVMIQWAWSYISYDRGARLITGRAEGPLVHGLTESRLPSTTQAEAIK